MRETLGRRPEPVILQLTPERLERAKRAAQADSHAQPVHDGQFDTYIGPPKWVQDFRHWAAVEAVAQHFDVRQPPEPWRIDWRGPTCYIKPTPAHAVHVIVTGKPDGALRIRGWCLAAEVSTIGQWRENVPKPAWVVTWSRLRPIADLTQ
jgi:hypothetical protein